jgi:WD40 repeat protein
VLMPSGEEGRSLRLWDVTSGRPVGRWLSGHSGWVRSVVTLVVNERPLGVTGGSDGTVRVWDLTTRKPYGPPLTGNTGPVKSVATMVVDGRPRVVSGSDDGMVRVWDLDSADPVGDPLVFPEPINALAVAPDGELVVASGAEITVLAPLESGQYSRSA